MAASSPALAIGPTPLQQLGDRLLEATPGLITWFLLLSPAWIPIAFGSDGAMFVAVAVLIFDLYWFFRSAIVITGIWRVYFRMRKAMRTDWLALCRAEPRVEGVPHPVAAPEPSVEPERHRRGAELHLRHAPERVRLHVRLLDAEHRGYRGSDG